MSDARSLTSLASALADRYRIERELGQGGMATVYLAEDLKHKRKVALKVLKPELAAVLGADRFVQEITTTAALQHPHILPLFDSGTAEGFLYYVMPFIQGETLRDKLNRETQLGVDEAVKIAIDVADALHYAHTQGVIHRDIKPENILLANGRPMVADFGIALAVSAAAGGRMTETGLSLGTPHYMSPEQATAEKEISARSDVYSLASVLYEMLTGQPPHVGGSAQQIIMRIVTDTARPVTELRKTVPPNVAAALARALEKLPADRFATAKDFAQALGNPGFTSARMTAGETLATAGPAWTRDPRSIGVMLAAFAALIALGWMITRPTIDSGPSEYDVALPDSAPADMKFRANFVVSPRGDFVIYERGRRSEPELWYRGLFDGTVRRIGATERAYHPTISPDGMRFAFIRLGSAESTVEVMAVAGGAPTVIAQSRSPNSIEWLADERILLTEGDGFRARLLDPRGGPSTDTRIRYCINPTLLSDGSTLLCGGGGEKRANWSSLADSASEGVFRTNGPDSIVFGSDFRVFDEKYLVWVSNDGDLLAAPVELAARRIGRSVRLVTGLGRDPYSGAGSYSVSATGTLVYANGINGAVGHLVRADERKSDTLPVGREAFLQFSMSPDGRRLASVVERTNDQELRLYDLRSGEHVVWMRRSALHQPVWSASGDRLATSTVDSVFAGPPDATSPPQLLFTSPMYFEGFSWMPDGRLVGTSWTSNLVVSAHLDRQPPSFDTLATFAALGRLSPDGRWMAYNAADFRATWVEPFPRTGQRYSAGTGSYPQWLSASEFVVSTDSGQFERISVDGSVQPPTVTRRNWFAVQRFVGIASGGFSLTSDRRVIYKQGAEIEPARYLRVVPHWVDRMKRAVDEANR